jgi:hypothetical protein
VCKYMSKATRLSVFYGVIGLLVGSSLSFIAVTYQLERDDSSSVPRAVSRSESDAYIDVLIEYQEASIDYIDQSNDILTDDDLKTISEEIRQTQSEHLDRLKEMRQNE